MGLDKYAKKQKMLEYVKTREGANEYLSRFSFWDVLGMCLQDIFLPIRTDRNEIYDAAITTYLADVVKSEDKWGLETSVWNS